MNELAKVEKWTSAVLGKICTEEFKENIEAKNLVKELILCETEQQMKDIKERYKKILCIL